MTGEWVSKNSHYEKGLCNSLKINYLPPSRYWDIDWNQFLLEIKKGKSIWLDMIRYSEQVLKKDDNANKDTITLFLVPEKKIFIKQIIVVKTSDIINKLNISEVDAKTYIALSNKLPRQGNFQAKLTLNDIKAMPTKVIIEQVSS